jgi:hypothetical protein
MKFDKLRDVAVYVDARLREPSSWATIAAALVYVGVKVDPAMWGHIVDVGVAFAGLAGVFLAEKGKTPAA